MYAEIRDKIEDLRRRFAELKEFYNIPAKLRRIEELDAATGEEGFWDEAERAQRMLRERAALRGIVDAIEGVEEELEEVEVLAELGEEAQDEATVQEASGKLERLEREVESLELKRMLGGEDDQRNAIVSINAGAGGTEAQDWAEMVLRMYLRYAERQGYETEMLDLQPGEEAGIKSATFLVKGPYAFGYLRGESGVHRLVRISPFDASRRRHTSFCSVFVAPEIEEDVEVEIDEKDLRIDTFRASGAGGQHVNKTDSAVRITHIPTGIVVSCQNERSQHQNRHTAMKILRARLYELEKEKRRRRLDELSAGKKEIGWGSQIRSYVLHPYKMVKDHRTGHETADVEGVLDGELEGFIKSYLLQAPAREHSAADTS